MSGFAGGPPGSIDEPNAIQHQKLLAQQRLIQEKERKKRNHAGMMQANEDRPRGPRSGYGHRADRDDPTRPLVGGGTNRTAQPDHAHGNFISFIHFLDLFKIF